MKMYYVKLYYFVYSLDGVGGGRNIVKWLCVDYSFWLAISLVPCLPSLTMVFMSFLNMDGFFIVMLELKYLQEKIVQKNYHNCDSWWGHSMFVFSNLVTAMLFINGGGGGRGEGGCMVSPTQPTYLNCRQWEESNETLIIAIHQVRLRKNYPTSKRIHLWSILSFTQITKT